MTAERKKNADLASPEQLEARHRLAERFLDEILVARIREGSIESSAEIPNLHIAFRADNPSLGDDFELVHVLRIALERDLFNECLLKEDPNSLPSNAADVSVALALLEEFVFEGIE